MTYFCTKMD